MSDTCHSENEKCKSSRGGRKRQVHNEVERRRKDKINSWIMKISELLPNKELQKQSKISILEQTVSYVNKLVEERDKLLANKYSDVQAEEIRALKKKLQFLEEQNNLYAKLLQEANISLSSLPKKPLKYSNKITEELISKKLSVSKANDQSVKAKKNNSNSLNKTLNKHTENVSSTTAVTTAFANIAPGGQDATIPKTTAYLSSVSTSPSVTVTKEGTAVTVTSSNIAVFSTNGNVTKTQNSINSSASVASQSESVTSSNGGVTSALSSLPMMSTHCSSVNNVYSKNMHVIILPVGANFVQSSPVPSSITVIGSTIENALPIIVPRNLNYLPASINQTTLLTAPNPGTLLLNQPQLNCPQETVALKNISGNLIQYTPMTNLTVMPALTIAKPSESQAPSTSRVGESISTDVPSNNHSTSVPLATGQISSTATTTTANVSNSQSNSMKNSEISASENDRNILRKQKQSDSNSDGSENSPAKCIVSVSALPSSDISVFTSSVAIYTSGSVTAKPGTISVENSNICENNALNERSIPRQKRILVNIPSLQILCANRILSLANCSLNMSAVTSHSTDWQNSECALGSLTNKATDVDVTKKLAVNKKVISNGNGVISSAVSVKPADLCSNSTINTCTNAVNNDTYSNLDNITNIHTSSSTPSITSKEIFSYKCSSVFSSTSSEPVATNKVSLSCDDTCNRNAALTDTITTGISSSVSNNVTATSNKVSTANQFTLSVALQSPIASVCSNFSALNSHKATENNKHSIGISVELSEQHAANIFHETNVVKTTNHDLRSEGVNNNLSFLHNPEETLPLGNNVAAVKKPSTKTIKNANSAPNQTCVNAVKLDNKNMQKVTASGVPSCTASNSTCNHNFHFALNNDAKNTLDINSFSESTNISNATKESTFSCTVPSSSEKLSEIIESVPFMNCNTHPTTNGGSDLSKVNVNLPSVTISNAVLPNEGNKGQTTSESSNSFISNVPPFELQQKDKLLEKNTKCNSILPSPEKSKRRITANSFPDKAKPHAKKVKFSHTSTSKMQQIFSGIPLFDNCSDYNFHLTNSAQDSIISLSNYAIGDSEFNQKGSLNSDILAKATESIFGNVAFEGIDTTTSKESQILQQGINSTISDYDSLVTFSNSDILSHSFALSEMLKNTEIRQSSNNELSSEIDFLKKNMSTANSNDNKSNDSINMDVTSNSSKHNSCSKYRKMSSEDGNQLPTKKIKENASSKADETQSHIQQLIDISESREKDINLGRSENSLSSVNEIISQKNSNKNSCATSYNLTSTSASVISTSAPNTNVICENPVQKVNLDSGLVSTDKNSISTEKQSSHSYNMSNDARNFLELRDLFNPAASESALLSNNMNTCVSSSNSSVEKGNDNRNSIRNFNEKSVNEQGMLHPTQTTYIPNSQNDITYDAFNSSMMLFTNHDHSVNPETNSYSIQQSNEKIQSKNISSAANSCGNYYSTTTSIPLSIPHNFPSSSSLSLHNSMCKSNVSYSSLLSFTPHIADSTNKSLTNTSTNANELNHSLFSLLKDPMPVSTNNSSVTSNSAGNSTSSCISVPSSDSTSNSLQSKYSALSLISGQTCFNTSVASQNLKSTTSAMTTTCLNTSSSVSTCTRNTKTSLSYSAERLIQSQCSSQVPDKTKSAPNNYCHFGIQKKIDHTSNFNQDSSVTNIFMPHCNSEMNMHNLPSAVSLPPVTSFPTFPVTYSVCAGSTTNSILGNNNSTRPQNVHQNFVKGNPLISSGINVDLQAQITGISSHALSIPSLTKSHPNFDLNFENNIYSASSFLQSTKSTFDVTKTTDSNSCFHSMFPTHNYSQQSHSQNYCHFRPRLTHSNSAVGKEKLPVMPTVPPFSNGKIDTCGVKTSADNNFSQSNSCYVGNVFYESPKCSAEEMNEHKSSAVRASQETFAPSGIRQNIHSHPVINQIQRKTVATNKTKSKKSKSINSSAADMGVSAPFNANNCMGINFYPVPDITCSKSNVPHVTNNYFKNAPQPFIPSITDMSNQQNRIPDPISNPIISPSPAFNPSLHQQNDGFLNLNFQSPNFTASSLVMHPPTPLTCTCSSMPIITQTFSSVPNFNLSNILSDMGCSSGDDIGLSPIKFPASNNVSSQSLLGCSGHFTISSSTHSVSRQSCASALYPPHPSIVHSALPPLLNHGPPALNGNCTSITGSASAVSVPSTPSLTVTQASPFRNVIHSLNFSQNER